MTNKEILLRVVRDLGIYRPLPVHTSDIQKMVRRYAPDKTDTQISSGIIAPLVQSLRLVRIARGKYITGTMLDISRSPENLKAAYDGLVTFETVSTRFRKSFYNIQGDHNMSEAELVEFLNDGPAVFGYERTSGGFTVYLD